MSRQRWTLFCDIMRTYDLTRGGRLKRVLMCLGTPGVHAVTVYRFGQWVRRRSLPVRMCLNPLYLLLYLGIQMIWGIDIPRSAQIGAGLYIGHFGGITISSLTMIGKRCNLSQGVTIGLSGHGDRRGVPAIGNDVYIAPGAKLFGNITIGNNVKIGANAVVACDIPDDAIVALSPGYKIVSFKGNRSERRENPAACSEELM